MVASVFTDMERMEIMNEDGKRKTTPYSSDARRGSQLFESRIGWRVR